MKKSTIAGILALAGAGAGCGETTETYMLDLNGKLVEIHSAAQVTIPKGNESVIKGANISVKGQEPIHVQAGGQEVTFYTTATTLQVGRGGKVRAVDLEPGERVIFQSDGKLILPAISGEGGTPAPTSSAPAEGTPPASGSGGTGG
ncbi:MAG: hypothetical protein L0216_04695 [Planctomycetales bacterium]|nr:hypothetical protein [Planctomycetales bacterium]